MISQVIILIVAISCIEVSSDCDCITQNLIRDNSGIDTNNVEEETNVENELKMLKIRFEALEERLKSLEKITLKSSKAYPVCTVNNYATPHHNVTTDSTNSQAEDLMQKVDQILVKLSNIKIDGKNPSAASNNRTRGKYLGCFQDSAEHRGLRGYARPSSSNTIEKCIEICRNGNYVYAGLQAGSWCLCGNTNQNPIMNKKLSDSSCNAPCSGYASQKCGSGWINAIYETGIEQFLIDENGHQLPESYIKPSIHSYFHLNHDGTIEN